MVDRPRPRAPSPLEVQPPPARGDLADAPPLRRYDPAEEAHGRRAVPRDDVAIDAQEEARLVGGGDAALTPRPGGGRTEALHPGAASEAGQPAGADEGSDARGRRIVRASHHRRDEPPVGVAQRATADARVVEVCDEQHRLEHAGRRRRRVRAIPPSTVASDGYHRAPRAVSSAGRAPALHAGGRPFEPGTAHTDRWLNEGGSLGADAAAPLRGPMS